MARRENNERAAALLGFEAKLHLVGANVIRDNMTAAESRSVVHFAWVHCA